jgi:hypothetical protein
MIDYRDLLRRYIAHVGYEGGATFIPSDDPESHIPFTAEEVAELSEMDRASGGDG